MGLLKKNCIHLNNFQDERSLFRKVLEKELKSIRKGIAERIWSPDGKRFYKFWKYGEKFSVSIYEDCIHGIFSSCKSSGIPNELNHLGESYKLWIDFDKNGIERIIDELVKYDIEKSYWTKRLGMIMKH